MFNHFKFNRSVNRVIEDKYYEQVAHEMAQENINIGTWARAKANAEGDEKKTEALYIKYRVQALHDEIYVTNKLNSDLEKRSEKDNYIVIPNKNKPLTPLKGKDLAFAKSAIIQSDFTYIKNNVNSFSNETFELLIEYSELCDEYDILDYLNIKWNQNKIL